MSAVTAPKAGLYLPLGRASSVQHRPPRHLVRMPLMTEGDEAAQLKDKLEGSRDESISHWIDTRRNLRQCCKREGPCW